MATIASGMSGNRFRGRELLPEGNLRVAALVESRLVEESSGLYVVFENRVIDWPGSRRVEPFTVARHDFDRQGPEDGMPQEVVARLREPGWERLVWIPFEVTHGDLYRFTIRYAHELQHYRQLLGVAESLSKVRDFLSRRRREGFMPTLKGEGPREFDADVIAFDTFEAIHGPVALQDYIGREAVDPLMRNFYDRVLPLIERFKAERPSKDV